MRAITAGVPAGVPAAAPAIVLALGLLVSGCGGDEPGASSSPASSPSASASASAGTEPSVEPSTAPAADAAPAPEPPPARNDGRGREAFARYVLEAWIYALNTNDPQALLDVSGKKPCGGCTQLAGELESRQEQGWYVELEGVQVSGVDVIAEGEAARAVMSVAIPESSTYNEDGSFRSGNPAHPRSTFEVDMVHEGGEFRLVAFSLY